MAKIKTNDTVKVIAGKDKGATGTVIKIMPNDNLLVVDGINLKKHHLKGKEGQPGEIVEKSAPMHVSNVMLVDPKTKEATRVGYIIKDGKKSRITKKSGTELK